MPYSSNGDEGTWDATKCVPVVGDQAAGDPCVYGGSSSADDDCDESTYCWDVEEIDGALIGVCSPFCGGIPDNWACAEGTTCLIANDDAIALCIDTCDPLTLECGEGRACTWNGQTFGCLVTTTDQAVGDPCGYANDCVLGSLCMDAALTPDCLGSACCVETCATDDPEACAGQLECASFFAEGRAPAGAETIGVCVSPLACGDLGCVEHADALVVDD